MYKLPLEKSQYMRRTKTGKVVQVHDSRVKKQEEFDKQEDAVSVMIYDYMRFENPKPIKIKKDSAGPHATLGTSIDRYEYNLEHIVQEGWSPEDVEISFEKDKPTFVELLKKKYEKNIGDVGYTKLKDIKFNFDEYETNVSVDVESIVYYN